MANLSYQGPLPLPTATWGGSLPWPTIPFAAASPTSVTGGDLTVYVLDAVLPAATTGVSYSQTLTAGGGIGLYTFALTAGALPSGLSLNTSTGVISGTPSGTGVASFTISATDGSGHTGHQALSISVNAPSSGGGSYTYLG